LLSTGFRGKTGKIACSNQELNLFAQLVRKPFDEEGRNKPYPLGLFE
jgi:hypothetical protein